MRITRDLLLKLARDTVSSRTRNDRSLLCVYLTGSVLSEEPLLGGTTDIDLIFVHSDEPYTEREIQRLSDDVHLDIAHYGQARFHTPRHLRSDAWLGSFLCARPLVLYDVQHWFDYTQASVFSHFEQPEMVLQRARPLAEAARQTWFELQTNPPEHSARALLQYLRTLEQAANAIACLSGAPLTERRFWLRFPARAEAIGQPELAVSMTTLFQGNEPPSADDWQTWLPAWSETLRTAAQQPGAPPRLAAARRAYYERAVQALCNEAPTAAVWIMLRTWALAQASLPDLAPAPAWEALRQTLGLSEAAFEARLTALDGLLDQVESILDDWARQNGIA
ncbi:MAG: hypothetical protein LDL12_08145 [Anaerolinea sp.]|nr:hypothetical protein [Anaerolinea sp.]